MKDKIERINTLAKKPGGLTTEVLIKLQEFEFPDIRFSQVIGTFLISDGHTWGKKQSARVGITRAHQNELQAQIAGYLENYDIIQDKLYEGPVAVIDDESFTVVILEQFYGWISMTTVLDFGPGSFCGHNGRIFIKEGTSYVVIYSDGSIEDTPDYRWIQKK